MKRDLIFENHSPFAGVDAKAVDALALCGGFVRDADQLLVVLRPRDVLTDQMDFDREICAAGVKCFIRPILLNENMGPEKQGATGYMKVTELTPGVRARLETCCVWPENN
jgi:hypothetical protein